MKVTIDGKDIDQSFADINEFDLFWKKQTKDIFSKGRFINQVEVDNKKFYSGYEEYITSHFHEIHHIHIVTSDEQELTFEMIGELKDYNRTMISNLEQVTQGFYGEMQEEDWKLFSQFIQGLEWMYQAMTTITNILVKWNNTDTLSQKISNIIQSFEMKTKLLMEAIEENDLVSIGDIIEFELKDIFNELDNILTKKGELKWQIALQEI